jgi:putative tryptophan/tyrosine transport system substrate-binding protein
MKRRAFIGLIGGAAATWPQLVRAQQPTMPVIGFLNSGSPGGFDSALKAFGRGLFDAGLAEGRNFVIEARWAEGEYSRLPELAADLVTRRVAVIVANGPAVLSVKAATSTIPIVFTAGFDPVEFGLVTSLGHPGGNLTGVSILNSELGPKRLELLRELAPAVAVMALLINPANPNAKSISNDVQVIAKNWGLQLHMLEASSEQSIADAFARFAELRVGGLVIGNDPFFTSRGRLLAELALRHGMPAIAQYREFVAAGGLMSYGGSLTNAYHLAGDYAGRILKGEKPADLPVQQSTTVELAINLKTAKAFGLSVPLSLLGRADELIE